MSRHAIGHRKALSSSRALAITGTVICVVGAAVAWNQYRTNKIAVQGSQHAVQSGSVRAPDITKPAIDAFDSYQVPLTYPRYIFIPSLSVRAIVRPLGLTADIHLAAPSNVFEAGWYTGSSLPGASGATVIDGHVSSWTTHGVFYDIKRLKIGDTIQIQRGDTSMLTYHVVKTQIYDANNVDMNAVLSPVNPSKPGLNLITCDGNVIKGTNKFNQRIVVFAQIN